MFVDYGLKKGTSNFHDNVLNPVVLNIQDILPLFKNSLIIVVEIYFILNKFNGHSETQHHLLRYTCKFPYFISRLNSAFRNMHPTIPVNVRMLFI